MKTKHHEALHIWCNMQSFAIG